MRRYIQQRNSRKTIKSIIDGLHNVRSREIKSEIEREIHGPGGTAEPVNKKPENIVQILRYLTGIDDSKQILHTLDEKFILPLSGTTQQPDSLKTDLLKKLHTLKSILHTSKSINWQKVGGYYGLEAVQLIKGFSQCCRPGQ